MMKGSVILISLISLITLPVVAQDESEDQAQVNFSKAYIIPGATSSKEIQLGGVETLADKDLLIHSLRIGFNADKLDFRILQAEPQKTDAELFEQFLRGTIWRGDYKTSRNIYWTQLRFDTVQNGFIAGELIHKTRDPANPDILRIKVAGQITTQYLIDEQDNGDPVWVNADRIDVDKLPADVIIPPERADHIRQLIQLSRMQGIEFEHNSSGWGRYHEYRMALVEDRLTGSVGIPPERYSSGNKLQGLGDIELKQLIPEEEEASLE